MLQHKIVLPQQMVLTFVPTSWLREMTNTFQLLPVEPVSQSSIMHIHVNMQDGHLWNWCTYRKDLKPIRLLAFELDWNNKVKKELYLIKQNNTMYTFSSIGQDNSKLQKQINKLLTLIEMAAWLKWHHL